MTLLTSEKKQSLSHMCCSLGVINFWVSDWVWDCWKRSLTSYVCLWVTRWVQMGFPALYPCCTWTKSPQRGHRTPGVGPAGRTLPGHTLYHLYPTCHCIAEPPRQALLSAETSQTKSSFLPQPPDSSRILAISYQVSPWFPPPIFIILLIPLHNIKNVNSMFAKSPVSQRE